MVAAGLTLTSDSKLDLKDYRDLSPGEQLRALGVNGNHTTRSELQQQIDRNRQLASLISQASPLAIKHPAIENPDDFFHRGGPVKIPGFFSHAQRAVLNATGSMLLTELFNKARFSVDGSVKLEPNAIQEAAESALSFGANLSRGTLEADTTPITAKQAVLEEVGNVRRGRYANEPFFKLS